MKQRKPGGDRPAAADAAPANLPGNGPVTPPVDGEAEPLPEDVFDRISHGELTLP